MVSRFITKTITLSLLSFQWSVSPLSLTHRATTRRVVGGGGGGLVRGRYRPANATVLLPVHSISRIRPSNTLSSTNPLPRLALSTTNPPAPPGQSSYSSNTKYRISSSSQFRHGVEGDGGTGGVEQEDVCGLSGGQDQQHDHLLQGWARLLCYHSQVKWVLEEYYVY